MAYTSDNNTFVGATLNANNSLTGQYDATAGYVVVRLWVNTPGNCNLILYYADDNNGTNEIMESYPVYGNNVSSINSLVKKAYARIQLKDVTGSTQSNVLVRTKFATRAAHPYLNYSTDDITANVTVAMEDITFNQTIDHSTASLLCYGIKENTTDHVALRMDTVGNIVVVGENMHATQKQIANVRPVVMGGYASADGDGGSIRTVAMDLNGYVKIMSGDITGLAVKPGTNVVFNVSGDATGLAVKPGTNAIFNVSGDATGLAVKPGTNAIFNVSGDATGLAVKPGTNAVFNVSGDATGLAVKPGTNVVFNVSGDATGLAVKPGTNAVFNVSGDATGLAVKPGTNAVFNVSGDATGLAVKPGTNAIFNVSGDATGLAVKPGTAANFKISSFDETGGLLVKSVVANYSNKLQGYDETNIPGSFQQIGTGNINVIYSISLFNSNNAGTYYVKVYSINGTPDNTTETNLPPILNYMVTFTARDIVFPHGINIGGNKLYVLVSTEFGMNNSARIEDPNNGALITPVQITVSYL